MTRKVAKYDFALCRRTATENGRVLVNGVVDYKYDYCNLERIWTGEKHCGEDAQFFNQKP